MCRPHREVEVLAQESGLAVYQCRRGCLHLRVHGVTLTLQPEEFHQLAMLVCDADIRLATRDAVRECATH